MILKACPVVLHPDGAPPRHLMLHHPSAGLQLTKGTVKAGEDPTRAAARELFEESGLETLSAIRLGHSDEIYSGQRWHFALCRIKRPVRDRWRHLAPDDGGTLFEFSWLLVSDRPTSMARRYHRALDWIVEAIG